jgi:hypothetical protein
MDNENLSSFNAQQAGIKEKQSTGSGDQASSLVSPP